MPGIVNLVAAISNDLVARLAAAGLPPLTDGQIVLGKDRKPENSFPPRVIFVPLGARWEATSPGFNSSPISAINPLAPGSGVRTLTMTVYGGGYSPGTTTVTLGAPDVAGGVQATATATVTSNGAVSGLVITNAGSGYLRPPAVSIAGAGAGATAVSSLRPTPQALAAQAARSIWTEWHKFEVHCWGVNSVGGIISSDPSLDYDATQLLYQQVIASTQALAAGVYFKSDGSWIDAQDDATVVDVVGHDFMFTMEIATPLVAEPMPALTGASVQIAPVGTQINPTTTLVPSTGGVPISAATNASPIQITTTGAHGLTTGNATPIGGVLGNTAANGFWVVTVIDAQNFTLNGSTGNGTYTGGGVVGAGSPASG